MDRVYVFTEYTAYNYEEEVRKWAVIADEEFRWEIMRFPQDLKPIKIEEITDVEFYRPKKVLGCQITLKTKEEMLSELPDKSHQANQKPCDDAKTECDHDLPPKNSDLTLKVF